MNTDPIEKGTACNVSCIERAVVCGETRASRDTQFFTTHDELDVEEVRDEVLDNREHSTVGDGVVDGERNLVKSALIRHCL